MPIRRRLIRRHLLLEHGLSRQRNIGQRSAATVAIPHRGGNSHLLKTRNVGHDGVRIAKAISPPVDDGCDIHTTRCNPREAACFTFGYNSSVFAQRVHDVCESLMRMDRAGSKCSVIALDGTGPLAAAALAIAPEKLDGAAIDTHGFRFGKVLDLQSPDFQPAAAKYGDVPGTVTLAKANAAHLLVLGEGESNADPVGWLLDNAK